MIIRKILLLQKQTKACLGINSKNNNVRRTEALITLIHEVERFGLEHKKIQSQKQLSPHFQIEHLLPAVDSGYQTNVWMKLHEQHLQRARTEMRISQNEKTGKKSATDTNIDPNIHTGCSVGSQQNAQRWFGGQTQTLWPESARWLEHAFRFPTRVLSHTRSTPNITEISHSICIRALHMAKGAKLIPLLSP